MAVYTVLNTDGDECEQPYLSTDSDVRQALGEWLGDMGIDADVNRVWTTARARDAITYVEPHGFRFVDKFDPLDHLVTLADSPEAAELRAWLLTHWIPAHNRPDVLDRNAMCAWPAQADENEGLVYIGRIWSVTGLPQSFNVWEVAP